MTKRQNRTPKTPPASPAFDPTNPLTNGTTGRPVEGDQNGGNMDNGSDGDAQGETVAETMATASSALASLDAPALEAAARATLLGTIGAWGDAGAGEIERVSGLLQEQVLSPDELREASAALERVGAAVAYALGSLRTGTVLDDILKRHGLTISSVLVFDEASGTVVTRAGRKLKA